MSDVTLWLRITNTYEDAEHVTYEFVTVPAPDEEGVHVWADDYLFQHTGTGPWRSNDPAHYEVKVLGSSELSLLGLEFEWVG
jgi:hypothetical protein